MKRRHVKFTDISSTDTLQTPHPQYLFFDHNTDPLVIQRVATRYPHIKLVCSYCNEAMTPDDLPKLLSSMYSPLFYAYRFETRALSSLDALHMCLFVREQTTRGLRISGLCTGEKGFISHILGRICGNALPDTQTELREVYSYDAISASTRIYGLIGKDISKSLSHFVHNAVIRAIHEDAVYIKIPVLPEELSSFFQLAKKLNVAGLSVTMPLKELILPFLDKIDPLAQQIGAVNTIVFEQGKAIGFNTDGNGAIDAIETRDRVTGKNLIIIGAGGAAKAIAHVAYKRGASVTILNRTVHKAEELSSRVNGRGHGLEQMQTIYNEGYDILINCTPEPLPIDPRYILPQSTIMDIRAIPIKDSLCDYAKQMGATVVYGHEMWINQGIAQAQLWFKGKADIRTISKVLSSEMESRIFRG